MTGRGFLTAPLLPLRQVGQVAAFTLRLAWRASRRLVATILLLMAVQAALQPVQLWFSRAVIDRAALDLAPSSSIYSDAVVAELPLLAWIALAAASLAAVRLIQPIVTSLQAVVSDRLTAYASEQLLLATDRLQGLERFEDPQFADDLQRARAHSTASVLLLWAGSRTMLSLFTIGALLLTLGRLHPAVPALLVLAAFPYLREQWRQRGSLGGLLYQKTPQARRLEYLRDLHLTPEPAKDLRLYGLSPFVRGQYEATFRQTTGALTDLRRRLTARLCLAGALGAAAPAGVYLYVVWSIGRGGHTLGDLALYGGAAVLLHGSLQMLVDSLATAQQHVAFLPSLSRVLDAPPDLPLARQPRPAPRPLRQGIVFEHVAFRYPGSPATASSILRDISFAIRPGECLALVGHNGAGKTTLVKLLLRLYDPTSGRILLDGVDLREYDLRALRREMSVIFQDFTRYELTIGENIGAGNVETLDSLDSLGPHDKEGVQERLLGAAAKAGAEELIRSLPQGLATPLGRQFGGRELSGGEWQKLALARAFVREAQVLVLDEPTAALDVQTEYEVYTRFHDLTRGRMTLLISHRLSTVRMADRILYLADGVVAENGTHEQLLARGGGYARLYGLQAAQFTTQDKASVEVSAGTPGDAPAQTAAEAAPTRT